MEIVAKNIRILVNVKWQDMRKERNRFSCNKKATGLIGVQNSNIPHPSFLILSYTYNFKFDHLVKIRQELFYFNSFFYRWKVGKWSNCMACKHQSGIRIREVECVREAQIAGDEDMLIEDENCTDQKPGTRELCESHKTCSGRRRREIDGIPEEKMRNIWRQMKRDLKLLNSTVSIVFILKSFCH